MSYIGNTSTTQTYAAAIDTFNGDGVTTAFTLSRPVATVAQIEVVVNNVQQAPGSYTVSGNTLTFTGAPSSGTANIYVYYTSPVTQVIAPSTGTVGTAQLDIANFNGTGAMTLPTGTTTQRPGSPINGQLRMNTTIGQPEWYDSASASWKLLSQGANYAVDYLVVAGGGSGGWQIGGGGGAGGYLAGSSTVIGLNNYFITVGAGGAGSTGSSGGANGSNSVFSSFTAIGGGKGGNNATDQASGGSGGGCGEGQSPGSGTAGQGNAGGVAYDSSSFGSGGGGGAGSSGGNGTSSVGGNGGPGLNWQSLGTYYAGGGAGGLYGGTGGTGGTGGGGNAGASAGASGSAGTANTGGGGGGGCFNPSGSVSGSGGAGGSGIVIIRYAGSQRGTGGTVTSSGGYTYHTFTTSGTFTA